MVHSVRDKSKDEKDRRDECLVPVDSDTKGFITDDVILKTLFVPLTKDTRCIVLMDACHSGTLSDLRYKYISGNKNSIENNKSRVNAKVLLLSGCKDMQTSDDSVFDNVWNGAMTKYFLDVLKSSGYSLTCYSLLRKLRGRLRKNGHTQIPQITCSRKIRGSTIFSDSEPNRNAFIS